MKKSKPISGGELSFPISLSKYLSISGVASRRKATELIKFGKVKVNNLIITEPGLKLNESDVVVYDDNVIVFGQRYYIVLNKPRGYVCTSDDPYAEKKAIDLVDIPGVRLFTAGRLDKDSEGLIIITNDGEYASKLTHPKYQTQKTYRVIVSGHLNDETLARFCAGVEDQGEILKAKSVIREADNIYKFTLTEGKNREIRRLVKSARKKTIRLQRIAIGRLSLGKLKIGEWRHLSQNEVSFTLTN